PLPSLMVWLPVWSISSNRPIPSCSSDAGVPAWTSEPETVTAPPIVADASTPGSKPPAPDVNISMLKEPGTVVPETVFPSVRIKLTGLQWGEPNARSEPDTDAILCNPLMTRTALLRVLAKNGPYRGLLHCNM